MDESTAATPAGNDPQKAPRQMDRRALLKVLAASSGAVAAGALMPGKWTRPVIEAGLLPAHAQVSPTCSLPDTPAQLTPPDDTTFPVGTDQVVFTWTEVAIPDGCEYVTYCIEIQRLEDSTGGWVTVIAEDNLTSPTYTAVLDSMYSYRWRVWAHTAAGCGVATGYWYFQFAQAPPVHCVVPQVPQQVSPADGAVSPWSDNGVTLDWDPVPLPPGCTSLDYTSQIEKQNRSGGWDFVGNLMNSPDTAFQVPAVDLNGPGYFRWWASARTEAGFAASGWWYFTLEPVPS